MSSHGDDLLVQGLIATSEAGERMRAVGGRLATTHLTRPHDRETMCTNEHTARKVPHAYDEGASAVGAR